MSTLPEFKTRLRGTASGYDVYMATQPDHRIGSVQKAFGRPVTWEAVRNGRIIHKGSETRKLAILVLVNAWVASQ